VQTVRTRLLRKGKESPPVRDGIESAYRFAAWSVAAAAMIADHHRCCEECSVLASMLHAATAASPERTVGNSLAASMLATATAMG
jgi:hypothetical protein